MPTSTARVIDYVEVHRNPDVYDGEFICVAGQITNYSSTDDYSFYFNDRLSQYDDGLGFTVELDHSPGDSKVRETYHIGDYVIVEGTWSAKVNKDVLEKAIVTHTGIDAEQAAKIYLDSWENDRKEFAVSTPISNYMEIFNNESYDGKYVRIVGKISASNINGVTNHHNIGFRNPTTNELVVDISLKGCPLIMQKNCIDGEYAIISGKLDVKSYSATISDCYVECVGEDAEKIYNSMLAGPS